MTGMNTDWILHEDLTTVSDVIPFLKDCMSKWKDVPEGSLLQVQVITNISVPTYEKPNDSSSDNDTLKVVVTDGHNHACALVPESVPGMSLKTPPGTKIRITQPVPRVHGRLLILTKTNCEVLGGKVTKLIQNWELQKKMVIKPEWGCVRNVSSVADETPPVWKPFDHGSSSNAEMKTTLAGGKIEGAEEAKSQFEVQRDEAIQEEVAVIKCKTFKKPKKHLVAKEIKDIMDQGFSEVEAETAIRQFKNFHKALKFLKESRDRQEGKEVPKKSLESERKFQQRKGVKMGDDDDRQDIPAEFKRPANDVVLYEFIEGQIKARDDGKLTKSLKLEVDKAPEKCIKDLEGEMERLSFTGPRDEDLRGNHHEMGDRDQGGPGGSRGTGGGDTMRRPHSSQQRSYNNKGYKAGRHVSTARFQSNNRQRGHHRQSNRPQPNKNYQEQWHRGMAPGQDPRIFRGPSACDSMMSTPTFFGQNSRIHDSTSSYRYDPRMFQACTGNDHRMQEVCGNNSYSSALSEHQGQRFPSNVGFTQYPPPAIPNHAHFTRFPPPPLTSNYNNNRHFHIQASSSQQISSDLHHQHYQTSSDIRHQHYQTSSDLHHQHHQTSSDLHHQHHLINFDLHHQQHQISDVSHHDNVNDVRQSNIWGDLEFVASTPSGTSIYTQKQSQPPIVPDNPQLLKPGSPAHLHSVVPAFQYDEEIARNPGWRNSLGVPHHHSPPPDFRYAQSMDREYFSHRHN